jgi:hypothetical protein
MIRLGALLLAALAVALVALRHLHRAGEEAKSVKNRLARQTIAPLSPASRDTLAYLDAARRALRTSPHVCPPDPYCVALSERRLALPA